MRLEPNYPFSVSIMKYEFGCTMSIIEYISNMKIKQFKPNVVASIAKLPLYILV